MADQGGGLMQPGRLDRRVQFRRRTLTEGPLGQVETWANHGSPVWASKADISDGERWRAGEVAAHVTSRFVIRWSAFSAAITPTDRLVCDGQEFDVVGRKEGDGRRHWIELTCAARSDR